MNRIEKIWLLNAVLFLLVFFFISYFNRFAEDDFLFLETVKQKGIWQATLAHYHSWNTRWFAIAWVNTWYWLIEKGIPIFVFNWLSLLIMIFGFYRLLSRVGLFTSSSQLRTILFSMVLSTCFFFSTFNISDSWFWINSTTMYLWDIGLFCLGLSVLMKQEKLSLRDYILVIVSGLYVGGASEPFLITLLLGIPFYSVITNQLALKQLFLSRIVIALFWFSILIAFLIELNGTGHGARSNVLPQTSLLSALGKSCYFTIKILFWHFPFHIIPLILFSVPWYYLGYINKSNTISSKLVPLYLKGILAIFILTYINTLPIVYLMGDYGPSRAWTPISFYSCIITAFLFYRTGEQLKLKYFSAVKVFEITGIIAFVFLLTTGIYYSKTARRYSQAYDAKKPFNELPASGWIHSAKKGATDPN